jgi:hypothetical protein
MACHLITNNFFTQFSICHFLFISFTLLLNAIFWDVIIFCRSYVNPVGVTCFVFPIFLKEHFILGGDGAD